jgi:large subunit ribosomal protein L9
MIPSGAITTAHGADDTGYAIITTQKFSLIEGDGAMRVLLLKDVKGLGKAGDVKEVAGGHATNYLFPKQLARPATEGSLKTAQQVKEAEERKVEKKASEAKTLAAKFEGQSVVFKVRSGEGDRLYGSITAQDVADALGKSTGIAVDKRLVDMEHSIKSLGRHAVTLRLGGGHSAVITVIVERSQEPE